MAVYALFTGIPHGMEDPKEATLRLFPNTTSDDVDRFLLYAYSMPPGTSLLLREPKAPYAFLPLSCLYEYFKEEGDKGGPVQVTFTTPQPQSGPGGPGARLVQSHAHPPTTAPPSNAGTVPPNASVDTSNSSTRKLPYSLSRRRSRR